VPKMRLMRPIAISLFVLDPETQGFALARGGASADAAGSGRPALLLPLSVRGPGPRAPPRGLDPGGDQNVERLRLLERIDRVVADPDEFEARLVRRVGEPGDQRGVAPVAEPPWAGMIGSNGLSDQDTPLSAKIASSAFMNAGFNLPLRSPLGVLDHASAARPYWRSPVD
jgi:hypothetical protein